MMHRRLSSWPALALTLAALGALPACGPQAPGPAAPAPAPPPAPVSLADTLAATGQHATLLRAFEAAGMTEALRGEVTVTIFAPTDDAFGRLPAGALDAMLADPGQLGTILARHVMMGRVDAAMLTGVPSVATMGGELPLSLEGGLHIGPAAVIRADVAATNGVVHVIDAVLLPAP